MRTEWEVLHEELETGRILEGWKRLEYFDLREQLSYDPSEPQLAWFVEAVQVVKTSINEGFFAKLRANYAAVYQRLRMHHEVRGQTSSEEIRGVVVPALKTIFFSRRGKLHLKVLYEETAHTLARPVPKPEVEGETQFERYKCHLQIYEGLQRSRFFSRLGVSGQREVRRLLKFLESRCRVRVPFPTDSCTCTL